MATFVADNSSAITGTLYFWRKTNNSTSPSYCSWVDDTFVDNGEDQVMDPNGIIRTGQGFFVEAQQNATEVVFHNTQRVADTSNQFFKNSTSPERHRIWLNFSNTAGAFSQMEMGYVTGGTNDLDNHDGKFINDGIIGLYSIISDKNLVIQGRALPFDPADEVPLGFYATSAATYTISIDHVDGLFTTNQSIILKDLLLGTYQDLTQSSYTFDSESGTFNSRFVIVYTTPLNTFVPILEANQVVVYRADNMLIIHSGNSLMNTVNLYDIRGREIASKKHIEATKTILYPAVTNQVLLVQIITTTGEKVVKKIVF
jgi:hypothetical protein